jgi:glycosyltransferase involved in cell wall biosynthesis
MACGTPVIVSDATSLPEVVGGAGYAISPGDVRGFAGALLAVLTDPELAADLREKGLRRAALFSWERTARATLEALRRLQP